MLAARNRRAERQSAALVRFDRPLISITVVMPGPVKDGSLPRRVMLAAIHELDALTKKRKWPVLSRRLSWQDTGLEAIYVIDFEPDLLKAATVALEDRHALGRLWDLDVIAPGQQLLSRKQLGAPARRCLVCERSAFECGRSRRHSIDDLLGAIHEIASDYDLSPSALAE
jgi:holo-ACP synthase